MAFDAFLKIEGIKGESRDNQHAGEIDVLSYSFGASNTTAIDQGGGAGAGKSELTDVNFVVHQSAATVPLLVSVATGKHHKEAVLSLRAGREKVQEYYKITLYDVAVTSVHESGLMAGDRPTNGVSLNYGKIEWSYRPLRADGSLDEPIVGSYDRRTNTAG